MRIIPILNKDGSKPVGERYRFVPDDYGDKYLISSCCRESFSRTSAVELVCAIDIEQEVSYVAVDFPYIKFNDDGYAVFNKVIEEYGLEHELNADREKCLITLSLEYHRDETDTEGYIVGVCEISEVSEERKTKFGRTRALPDSLRRIIPH